MKGQGKIPHKWRAGYPTAFHTFANLIRCHLMPDTGFLLLHRVSEKTFHFDLL